MSNRYLAFVAGLLLFLAAPAMAEGYTFAPDDCEFQAEFPSEPYTSQRCNPDDPQDCHKVTTFMKVFDLKSTVTFNVTCNKSEESMYERYSADVMKTTLIAMGGRGRLEDFDTGYQEDHNAKMAFILGHGDRNGQDIIYIAQLWLGHKSLFTIEAEVIGDFVKEADDMFAQVMSSVRLKEKPAEKGQKKEDDSGDKAKKDEEKSDEKEEQKEAEKP